MIAAGSHRSGSHKEAHIQGWLVSIFLHGTMALAAILFVKQIQLDPQNEAFKWNVAMVSPTQQVQSSASSQNQAPARSVSSTTSAPSTSARQTAPAQTFSPPQLLAQPTTPPISERTATPVPTESPTPTPTELTTSQRSTAHSPQPAEPIRHELAARMATESASIVKPADAPKAVSAEPDTQTAQSDQASPPTQMAAISPAPPSVPAKRDYGWLSEAILRRVEELKRYPASARVERAEGKAMVKAVINEDGSLGEVEVVQSSGYPALDKAAIETMRQAAPFHLPHPLGQPRMTIKIPMSYRLDR
jgi:periplasmic protein TonB